MSEVDHKRLVDDVVAELASKGLAVVPAEIVEDAMHLHKAKISIMRRDKMTPYEVSKFRLLPGNPTLNTVKKMLGDGRIRAGETFIDSKGKTYITRAAINRLNGVV